MEDDSAFNKKFDFKLFVNAKNGFHNTLIEKSGDLTTGSSYEDAVQDSKIMFSNLFFLIRTYGIDTVDMYDMIFERLLDDIDLRNELSVDFLKNITQTITEILSYIDDELKEDDQSIEIDSYKTSLKNKIRNKEKNIEKEISSEKSLQAFKKQLNDNPEFLKKVFRCYLTDVLET